MYRVTEIHRIAGSCMRADKEKYFFTKFMAKLYYAKVCKQNDYTTIEEKFADTWVQLANNVRSKTK